MARSLRVRQERIGDVKLAVRRNGFLNQRALAEDAGLALSTVSNFLTGKPVDRAVFEEICDRLSLSWQEIADLEVESLPLPPVLRHFWGEAPDVSVFYGRSQELSLLRQWIVGEHCRIVCLLGMGGIGKTSLSVKLAQQLEAEFDSILWRSLKNAPPIQEFLTELVQMLCPTEKSSTESLSLKTARLIEALQQRRCLIVLDNCESLLQEGQIGDYRMGYEAYGILFNSLGETAHQSCVLLTSREKPSEIARLEGQTLPIRSLQILGLPEIDGYKLFHDKGCTASLQVIQPVFQRSGGNPLVIKILATTLQELFDNDVREFLDQDTILVGDVWRLLSEQFKRLSPVEIQVMYSLAIEREWMPISALRKTLFPTVSSRALVDAIESLQRRSLIEKQSNQSAQQPVISEYITHRLIEEVFQEIRTLNLEILNQLPLIKASTKDYVREAQVRFVLHPILQRLLEHFHTETNVRAHLDRVLQHIRSEADLKLGYATGNLLNLYRHLELDLTEYDFSDLVIRQAFLQDFNLQAVDFSRSTFIDSQFTQTFGGVLYVQWSPEGELLAASDTNGEIHLWQVSNQQRLLTLKGHQNWVRGIVFSPDGSLLASASDDGTIRIWEVSSGDCVQTITSKSPSIYGTVFSPDGKWLASSGTTGTIHLWNPVTGACIQILNDYPAAVIGLDVSPCGNYLVSGGFDHTIRVWDVQTGACLRTLEAHTGWVTGLRFSADGEWLVSPSSDRTIRVWRTRDWQCVQQLEGHSDWIWKAIFSPDGATIASCSADRTVKLWSRSTGQCLSTLSGHEHQVWGIAFSPEGQQLVSGSEDQTIALWEVLTGKRTATLSGYTNSMRAVAICPNTGQIVTGHRDKTYRIWNGQTGDCIQTVPTSTRITAIAIDPVGQWIATGGEDADIQLWNRETLQLTSQLKGHTNEIWGLSFSSDSRLLASGSFDGTIKLWDLEYRHCIAMLTGHRDRVASVAFHPENTRLASGSEDATIRLWDCATYDCLAELTGHTARVNAIQFDPQGQRLASASLDQTVRIWDVQARKCLQMLTGHTNWVMSVVFLADGKTIASAGCDRTIKLWNWQSGECLQTLEGHTNWIWSLALSSDGKTLVSASEDETLKLWNLETGVCLKTLECKKMYAGMRIKDAVGLSSAQVAMLKALGAEDDGKSADSFRR